MSSSYESMYPIVSPETLAANADYMLHADNLSPYTQSLVECVKPWFHIRDQYFLRPDLRKCVSVCLFKQNVTNKYPNEFSVDDANWYKKYLLNLQVLIRDFHRWATTTDCGKEWKMRVYLENQLYYFVDMLVAEAVAAVQNDLHATRLEIFVMASNSVGAQPGMMWRFMAFDDKSLDVAFVVDVDDQFSGKLDKIIAFDQKSTKTYGRFMSDSHCTFRIKEGDH